MGWVGHQIFNTRWNTVGLVTPLPECQSKSAALEASGIISTTYMLDIATESTACRAAGKAYELGADAQLSTE
jgi:hypothetical protein